MEPKILPVGDAGMAVRVARVDRDDAVDADQNQPLLALQEAVIGCRQRAHRRRLHAAPRLDRLGEARQQEIGAPEDPGGVFLEGAREVLAGAGGFVHRVAVVAPCAKPDEGEQRAQHHGGDAEDRQPNLPKPRLIAPVRGAAWENHTSNPPWRPRPA